MKCLFCIKVCSKCHRILVANTMNFNKNKGGKWGLRAECKECRNKRSKKYYKNNKNEILERKKEWRQDNPHVDFNYNIKRHYGVNSNITKEQYQEILEYFGYKCVYCGCDLDNSNTTLDHILPLSVYYITDIWNIVPCCNSCNSSKNNKELLDWLDIKESMDLDRYEALLKYVDIMYNKYN